MLQLLVAANFTISLAYMAISGAIAVPLIRHHQLRANRLGAATAAIFFSCSVGHGLMSLEPARLLFGGGGNGGMAGMLGWRDAAWDSLTACVAVYYWSLRRTYGALMRGAVLFEDLRNHQERSELEAREEVATIRAEASAERMELLQGVFDSLGDVVMMIGEDGVVLAANTVATETFDLGPGRVVSPEESARRRPIRPDGSPMPRAEQATASAFATGQAVRGTLTGVHLPTGELRWLSASATPLFHSGQDRPYAVVTTSHDVTDAREAEAARVLAGEELARARDAALAATAAKSAFLATMSHEIRTPMNAVIGMTGLLQDTGLDTLQQEFVSTIQSSGDALLTVINDILDFSKIEAGELDLEDHPFELRDCIDSAVAVTALSASSKGIELLADVDTDCPLMVVGDASRFRQVVVNLLGNAVKFTDVGEIVVSVRCERLSADGGGERLSVDGTGPVRLTVAVTDTGIGIPADRMDRLFRSFTQVDPSTTRLYGGTGLGLAISRRLTRAMGGDLTATSEWGTGSTFTSSVVMTETRERRQRAAETAGATLAGRSVLVVDDNASSRRILGALLAEWGATSVAFGDPADAIETVADGAHFDVAVLDLTMPGMDGVELARALRRLPGAAQLPLVLLGLPHRLPADDAVLFTAVVTKPARGALLQQRLLAAVDPAGALLREVEGAGGRRRTDGPAAAGTKAPSLRVLLAEDNVVNQKVAGLMLAKFGHRVDTVSNGLEAVDAVQRVTYDVVLMDLQMPVLDGLAATRRIRGEVPAGRQPVILGLSASVLAEDREAGAGAGMDGYLTKPIRAEELNRALTDLRAQWRPPLAAPSPVV